LRDYFAIGSLPATVHLWKLSAIRAARFKSPTATRCQLAARAVVDRWAGGGARRTEPPAWCRGPAVLPQFHTPCPIGQHCWIL